jgi:ethanolamine utilization protein EutP (predicted NTPase)
VLGDKESGKTTLVAKLQGNEDPKKGAGLEYGYIDVRDEYRDGKNGMRNVLITVIMIYHYIKCILHPNISKLI